MAKVTNAVIRNVTFERDSFSIIKLEKTLVTLSDIKEFPGRELRDKFKRDVPRIMKINPDDPQALLSVLAGRRVIFSAKGEYIPKTTEAINIEGSWENNSKYPLTFNVSRVIYDKPRSEEGIKHWLSANIDGVGPVMAQAIYDKFGPVNALEAFNGEHDDELLSINGITENVLKRMKDSYEDVDVSSYLSEVMMGFDFISPALGARIVKKFKSKSYQVLKNSPYDLTEVEGVGFKTADAVALKVNPDLRYSNERTAKAISYVLEQSELNGNMFLEQRVLIAKTLEVLDLPGDSINVKRVSTQCVMLRNNGEINVIKAGANGNIYSKEAFDAETLLAKKFIELLRSDDVNSAPEVDIVESIERFEMEEGIELDPQQKEAVIKGLTSPVAGIVGGPGTGKTTIVKAILFVGKELGIINNVSMQAPTGRAARRLGESSGYKASTIHKAMSINPMLPRGLENSLAPYDTIILDEASMVGGFLGEILFSGVKPGTRIIIIGDTNQLPPVEAGAVLEGLIKSGLLPLVRLETIHRVKGSDADIIISNAKAINEGRSKELRWKEGVFEMHQTAGAEASSSILIEEYIRSINANGVSETILLSPIRKKGYPAGVFEMNRRIKERINPSGVSLPGRAPGEIMVRKGVVFNVNDRIGTTKTVNNVPNGEVGTIIAINQKDREIVVSIDGYDDEVTFEGDDLLSLDLAYATTIHKSQGSEYKHVIMSMEDSYYIMLRRKLVYTGVTRAKSQVTIVGSPKAFYSSIMNDTDDDRNTLLPSLINQANRSIK